LNEGGDDDVDDDDNDEDDSFIDQSISKRLLTRRRSQSLLNTGQSDAKTKQQSKEIISNTPSSLSTQPKFLTASHINLKMNSQQSPMSTFSSPSAAVLFGLNNSNNSFSMFTAPDQINFTSPLPPPPPQSNITPNNNNTSKLASRLEIINGSTDIQTISADINLNSRHSSIKRTSSIKRNRQQLDNYSQSDVSTDLSCIDDAVIAAFANDFSYEFVVKK
jgi:hypothetical protein